MTFPKYNHPAKLYDEINLDEVNNIRKSKETISYYIGFYKDGKLVKFEKYINDNKVMDFAYEYDERGNLIKIYKKIRFKIGESKMKKLLIGMIGTILLSIGALKMSQPFKKKYSI